MIKTKFILPRINLTALKRVVGHFGHHLKPHKTKIILSFFALLGVSVATVLKPWPLKLVFDYALMTDRISKRMAILDFLTGWDPVYVALFSAGLVVFLAGISGFLGYRQEILTKTVGHSITAAIRLQLFSHIQRLPQSYHDYRETGELITSLTGDISLLQDLLVETFIRISGQLVIILGMIFLTFMIDWQLALLILAVMPFFFLATITFSKKIKRAANRQREKYGKMVATMEETLSGISQVKVFKQEKKREKIISKSVNRDFKAGLKTARLSANYSRIVEIISAIGIGMVLLAGTYKAITGSISPGDLLVFITYVRGIYRPINTISRLSTRVAKATVRGEKLMDILELRPEVSDELGVISASKIKGDIKFNDVVFGYVDKTPVLKGLSCSIPPTQTTVIIGPTGAGKSTIAKLLLRLYDIQGGSIIVDNNEITKYRIRSLRKRITSLTQEAFLFRTSIVDNIAFGKPRASQEDIEKAANFVGADEFIRELPDGYDTLVGEGGLTLSGGQRQRISFARAALRDTPIMIFDEPATGLDIYAEKEAMNALKLLKQGRTLIIITHRLNFLELADWTIYIQNGQLVEEGVPVDLLNKKEKFYDFVGQEINRSGYDGWPDRTISSRP